MTITRVAIIGLGLLGGSIGLAIKARGLAMPPPAGTATLRCASGQRQRGLVGHGLRYRRAAVADADLVILCVPVGAMGDAARAIAPGLARHAIISDVGSSKAAVADRAGRGASRCLHHPRPPRRRHRAERAGRRLCHAVRRALVHHHPARRRRSGALEALSDFWTRLGSKVELMDAAHHDLVLAVTSHIPHLIAYTIVGTASDLEDVTQSEVIKYSAGGFRDFTRIAASDPVMWRDVFLTNRGAVLEMLGRFTEDLTALQRAIRSGDGDTLFDLFTRTRAIRRQVIEQGQDDERPDFGREHGA
jgi:cyclohexadieny/prephenate dehydrogenase